MNSTPELLCVKELATILHRSTRWVYQMRAKGFVMPGGTCTLAEARAWLSRNPPPFGGQTMRGENSKISHT